MFLKYIKDKKTHFIKIKIKKTTKVKMKKTINYIGKKIFKSYIYFLYFL